MTENILCQFCNSDITSNPDGVDRFRVMLESCEIPRSTRMYVRCDVVIYPPVEGQLYFCDLICLNKWLNKKL